MLNGSYTLKPKMCIGIALFIMGIIFLLVGMSISAEVEDFKKNAGQTLGVVTEIDNHRVRRKGWNQYEKRVYVSYTVDGQHYVERLKCNVENMELHDILTVYYDPENPAEARAVDYTGGSDNFVPISAVLIASGMVFAVASCLSANDKSRENPADTGAPVMAEQADGLR